MPNFLGMTRGWLGFIPPLGGLWVGNVISKKERERTSTFRDKSALYAPLYRPGDPPSW